jgi:pyruvate dehydrogenase E2 component (dihydrolipoamide acetyltransferase)
LATDVTMPRLSDSMEEGTVLKWLVDEGGEVKRGEALVEIETDKANMTYEADTDGTLIEIVAQAGDTLEIGEVIARIGDPSEAKGDGGGDSGEAAEAEEEGAEEEGAEAAAEESTEAEGEKTEEGAVAEGEDEAEADSGADESKAEAEEADTDGDRATERGGDGDGATSDAEREGAGDRETATATKERPSTGDNGASADGGRVKASPVARRMARELGVEIAQLEGTGPGGRIVKADVEAAAEDGGAKAKPAEAEAEAPAEEPEKGMAEPAEEKEEPERERAEAGAKGEVEYHELSRLQQVVTRRMAESKATAPDFALSLDVDMTLAVELRSRLKEVADPVPSFNDMVVKACANSLREHPRVNGAYRDGKFELYSNVNVGVAVAAADALVVPTIFDADTKSLGQIARDARGLIEKVRDQKITPPEVSGGTFTVSNLGMYGIESFTAIINPPQAALLSVGALKKKPAVDDSGRVVARDQMTLTLICDHRILYGADGAQFLARVRELLEQPLSLAL